MFCVNRKKELCVLLANRYREIAELEKKILLDGPEKLYAETVEGLPKASDRTKDCLMTISGYMFFGLASGHTDTLKKVEKYEKLANSKKLYIPGLVRIAKLERELYNITTPVGL